MLRRTLLLALSLAACASAPRPATAPAAAAPARPAEPEVAYTAEPVPLTDESRRALVTAREQLANERFDDAQATLRGALDHHPDDVALRMRLALLAAEDGRTDDAVTLLRAGLGRGPGDADLLTFVGGVRLRQALDGATIERRRGSIAARPSTDEAAEARQVRSWLEAARDAFAEALRARANHLGAMEGAGVVAGRLGDHAAAVATWERVVRLTHDPDASERLAAAVAAAGDRARAITLYEAIVHDEPARAGAHAALAELYAAAGRADDAARARGRATFHEWVGPFAVAPTDDNVAAVSALAPWFDEAPADGAAAREAATRAALERLGAARTDDARALLAAFAWHHSHDAMEAVAWEALRAHGSDAADTLYRLFEGARSMCTMRSSAEALARLHDRRLFEVLARALPRDTGFFPVDAANALDLLGDPRAVPLLVDLVRRAPPQSAPDDPTAAAGFAAARARAVLALGAFDTAASREALQSFAADADLGLEAHAALYRITHAPAHLQAIERAPVAQRRRAEAIMTGYIERAGTPQARAAATRARTAVQAREAAERAREAATQRAAAPRR
ncbi:MAG: tetratricopeptide repeat protein [Polyangiales bacterium]